jgi:nucleoside-diphosphate-sugar epimerase
MPSPLFQLEPYVTFIKGDLRNINDLEEACKGVDIVFHTASVINFYSRLPHDRQLSIDINVKGTQVRFIHSKT